MTVLAQPRRRDLLIGRWRPPTPPLAATDAACLARQGIVCRTCGDLCPTGAIRFRPQPGGVAVPLVDAAACTGCGECAPACPVGALTLVEREAAEPAGGPARA